jgi:diadenosine tetraphosphatase ApaH/serine/threonine PP2A family protein phosphatase
LIGHTHIPGQFRFTVQNGEHICEMEQLAEGISQHLGEGRLIINPGSIGQPRDGDARASYAILDADELTLEYRRVPYDIGKTQHLMEKAKLPQRNVMRLSYGW